MATLLLGTVGRFIGGPIGGLVGTALGGIVDRGLFGGGGKARDVGRIGNLTVQSAAYGEPISFIVGRMRAAGNLIWTAGIKETASRSGGGKRSGPATTSYAYSSSFAVGLAAREISGIGRIWADGKLIRDAAGAFVSPVTMRIHHGSETQTVDPLIAAAEGIGEAPAYRGIAYVVFEDLPLADYGNRIPNLTFEIVADADLAVDAGDAIRALSTIGGRCMLAVEGDFPAINGYVAGRSGSLAEALDPLLELVGGAISPSPGLVVQGAGSEAVAIADGDCQARRSGDARNPERHKRSGGETLTAAVELAFYDTSRDFQPGLQRVRRAASGRTEHRAVACAMSPSQAKTLAAGILARGHAARLRATVRLPWRYLFLQPGALVVLADAAAIWCVREVRFEGFVIQIDVERVEATLPAGTVGDGGRALAFDDTPAGTTILQLLDIPGLPGDLPTSPRIWIAAAGASPGWRRAAVELSGDNGASYARLGVAEGGVPQGLTLTAPGSARPDAWDRFSEIVVELASDAMWLEGRTPASVLSGGNMALVGEEILQFAAAEALSPRRFRLSGLLRGRRGTEAHIAGHVPGERFIMLDQQAMLAFDPPQEALGRAYQVRAIGIGDAGADPVAATVQGRALRPLSPAHLRLRLIDGALLADWTRRSRAGFGWSDFVDAPLAEESEVYQVTVTLDGRLARVVTTGVPWFSYSAADRAIDLGGTALRLDVAQVSGAIGPGDRASAAIML